MYNITSMEQWLIYYEYRYGIYYWYTSIPIESIQYLRCILYIPIKLYIHVVHIEYINLIHAFRNVLYYIVPMFIGNVYRSIGINDIEAIMSLDKSPNGDDHLTSIETIAIWTVRS